MILLVISKKTSYESYKEQIENAYKLKHIDKSYLDILIKAYNQHTRCLETLLEELTKASIVFKHINKADEYSDTASVSCILTVGGDGTVLYANHMAGDKNIPIVGLCSSGLSVGHLCGYVDNNIVGLVKKINQQELVFENVNRMKASIDRVEDASTINTSFIINDFLFCNKIPSVTTRYQIALGDRVEQHKSSGVWISTTMGSTAAIKACKGKEFNSNSEIFMAREILQDSNRSYKLIEGAFNSKEDRLVVTSFCENAFLSLDGQQKIYDLQYGDRVRFSRASSVRLAL
jgi:NAD kinase